MITTMNIKDFLNKPLFYVPYEFIYNTSQGIKTPVVHATITGPEINSKGQERYTINCDDGKIMNSTEGRVIELMNARIGGRTNSIFGGYETIYDGLYQTMDEAKAAMKNYIERELKKTDSSIKSLEKRKENLNKCLW